MFLICLCCVFSLFSTRCLQEAYKEKSRKCQAWEKAYGNLRSQVDHCWQLLLLLLLRLLLLLCISMTPRSPPPPILLKIEGFFSPLILPSTLFGQFLNGTYPGSLVSLQCRSCARDRPRWIAAAGSAASRPPSLLGSAPCAHLPGRSWGLEGTVVRVRRHIVLELVLEGNKRLNLWPYL